MARIRDFAVTIEATAVASTVLEMPEHQSGDLLLVFFNKDTPGGGPSTPSGWSVPTAWGANPLNSTGSGNYLFAKRAASSSETLTLSYTSETSITIVIAIKECFGSTVDDAITDAARSAADDTTLPLNGGTFTPTHNNSLIIGLLGTDSGFGPTTLPGWVNIFGGDAGANSLSASYTFQRTAAEITHPGYWGSTQDDSRWGLLAIRDDGNLTGIDPYPDRDTIPATIVANLSVIAAADRGTWLGSQPLQYGTIGAVNAAFDATAAAADSGYNPFHAAARMTPSSSKVQVSGGQLTLTADEDMTWGNGIIFGTFRPQLPRDYLDLGTAPTGGALLVLGDSGGSNYRAWCHAAQLSATTDPSSRQNFAIEVGSNDTVFAESGTLTASAIKYLLFLNRSYYGACSLEYSKLFLLNKTVMAGGTAATPFAFDQFVSVMNNGNGDLPVVVRSGSAATLWTAVQFGGGDPCHVNIQLRTFQFPRKADEIDYLDFHVSNNKVGVELYGKDRGSGDVDTIKFIGCVFTSDSPYYFRFNASHAAGTNLDLSGSTIVGATVTLRSVVSLTKVTFTNCPSFLSNNAALSECTFNGTKIEVGNLSTLENCIFNSSGSGHAIEVTTPGTYTFTGNTFSGYGANGTTDACIYNNSGGAVTINIAGGGDTPTIRNGAGASTTVNNVVTLALTNLKTGTEVRAYLGTDPATATEIDAVESSGTSFTFGHSVGGQDGYIMIHALGYQSIRLDLTYSNSNASIPIQQQVDRQYENPADPPPPGSANQIQKKTYGSSADSTAHNIVLDSAPTEGNTLILCLSCGTADITLSGWTLVTGATGWVRGAIYRKTAGAGESATVTVTLGTAYQLAAVVMEYDGLTGSVDQSDSQGLQGSGTANTTPTINTTVANLLLVAVAAVRAQGRPITGWDNSFTEDSEVAVTASADDNLGISIGLREVSTTGAYSSTASLTAAGEGQNVTSIAGFIKA